MKNPKNIAAMLDNYYRRHGDRAFHVLHYAQAAADDLDDIGHSVTTPVVWYANKNSWRTSYSCSMGALLSNALFLRENNLEFSHVYIHSDADLLIYGDLTDTISKFGNGFSAGQISEKWMHYSRCMTDPKTEALIATAGLVASDIRTGRQAGSFFSKDVWNKMIETCLLIYDEAYFRATALNWPVQEMAIPTLANHFVTGRRFRNIVTTRALRRTDVPKIREHSDNVVKIDDIETAILQRQDDECIGMKWFSPDLSDAARQFLRSKEMAAPAASAVHPLPE